ncbi:MAG: hypothetical protein WBV11_13560 [Salegentibacter sp.]
MKNLKIWSSVGCLLMVITMFSCSSKSGGEIGKWDDNIKLSQKEAQFSADNDSIVITTEGGWWWIANIALNGNSDYDLHDIDTSQENFVIDEPEFRIERKNSTEIHIVMEKNQTGSERNLIIGLEAGDYFDGIKIVQAADLDEK